MNESTKRPTDPDEPMTLADAWDSWVAFNRAVVPVILAPLVPLVEWLYRWIERWPRWARRLLDRVP